MQGGAINSQEHSSSRDRPPAGRLKRFGGLFLGLFIIWLLMTYAAPWGRQTDALRPIMDVIEERDIDATAYYYTDLKEFAEAEDNIRHALQYPPVGPAAKD